MGSLEIYNEKIYDLLSKEHQINIKQDLAVRQNGAEIVVQGLSKLELNSMEEFYKMYQSAMRRRKTAFTALNGHSSRSHAIFTIYIEQKITNKKNNKFRSIKGKLSIADLAGSENNKRTENKGERLKESKNINKSLLALGAVIDALNNGTKPPYRDSVLTRLLSDCLGGDSISTMICCVNGRIEDSSMNRRCLEFGSNSRKIENVVIKHIDIEINKENNNNINKRKRKQNPNKIKNKHNNIKRRKLTKPTKNHKNTDPENPTKTHKNIDCVSMDSPDRNKEITTNKNIKYRIQPTPTKFVPTDQHNLEIHEKMVTNDIMRKIDQLTTTERNQRNKEESKEKEEDRELSVYRNDQFGLPPDCNPNVINPNLGISRIKKARKLEKNGKFKEALIEYQKAKILLPEHKGLQKKMDKLKLKIGSDKIAKILSFDDIPENKEMKEIKNGKNKKRKKKKYLKKKTENEILSDIECSNKNEDDIDLQRESMMNTQQFSYNIDVQRLLNTMNTQKIEELKLLKTVGPTKAAKIINNRPFKTIKDLQKTHGFHTTKAWQNFIEKNRITFQSYTPCKLSHH